MGTIYTMGELLVEIMREEVDIPLDIPERFLGPFPSGAPAIFISTAARLGHRTKIWGGVGKDKFGDVLLERLTKDGVDCSQVLKKQSPTAVAFVSYQASGEREFLYHVDRTVAVECSFQDQGDRVPDFFHVMGCSLLANEKMSQEIIKGAQHFHGRGAKISFDPNLRVELLRDRSFQDFAGEILEITAVLLPGIEELLLCADQPTIDSAQKALFKNLPLLEVIGLKRGKRGATLFTPAEEIPLPPCPIDSLLKVVDPTGSGDCFDAAFLCALLEGKPLKEAGILATQVGALNATAFGPMEGDLRQLEMVQKNLGKE